MLLHDGKSIAESLVILEYIDETGKDSPFLPLDPYICESISSFLGKVYGREGEYIIPYDPLFSG